MRNIVVVDNPDQWDVPLKNAEMVGARTFLSNPQFSDSNRIRVFNLCRSYRYRSLGYYVSLLAEARSQKVFPRVETILDLANQFIARLITTDVDYLIQKNLRPLKSKDFVLSIYFGRNVAKQYDDISWQLFNLFQAPLLRARFVHDDDQWRLQAINAISIDEVVDTHRDFMIEAAREYFSRRKVSAIRRPAYTYDMAILVNPEEKEPPSDRKAIGRFIAAARKFNIVAETITREDYSSVPEYDALFIRETTAVNHHTYRFSRRAYAEGLVVIDDPLSILRCTNKVYLAELLNITGISTPRTMIVHKDNMLSVESELGLPCILKKPDSSFSQGVIKVMESEVLESTLRKLMKESDMVIAQEFLPTEFDWRIGIIDRMPLFACRYFMARDHWQIYNWDAARPGARSGDSETVPLNGVPEAVIKTALRAANLIGDGFYGVDIKEIAAKPVVIEINDNPSVESGVEDAVVKDGLYLAIMQSFYNRLKKRER
jgi:glutathione synthase/RimK-type ligase-like ATP-grasp enzyme